MFVSLFLAASVLSIPAPQDQAPIPSEPLPSDLPPQQPVEQAPQQPVEQAPQQTVEQPGTTAQQPSEQIPVAQQPSEPLPVGQQPTEQPAQNGQTQAVGDELACEEVILFPQQDWECQLVSDISQVDMNQFTCWEETDYSEFDCVEDEGDWDCEEITPTQNPGATPGSVPGTNGQPGTEGQPGTNGTPGTTGTDGTSGTAAPSGVSSAEAISGTAILGAIAGLLFL
ncbi:hypothetical protein EDD86DRAFT_250241 [Gorgonomyces haynaldii]|nr:hypothetical protein EDD86DRAFT_250241 [Gorgonomyces haynaldii]